MWSPIVLCFILISLSKLTVGVGVLFTWSLLWYEKDPRTLNKTLVPSCPTRFLLQLPFFHWRVLVLWCLGVTQGKRYPQFFVNDRILNVSYFSIGPVVYLKN